jgi:hypothetical protein
MTTTQINARLDAIKTIEEEIASSEQFIKKCKASSIQSDKYLAVFPTIMMGVKSEGGKAIFTDEPYSFEYAKVWSNSITNGHGEYPIIMSHSEYIERCIAMQIKHIDTMRNILKFQAI